VSYYGFKHSEIVLDKETTDDIITDVARIPNFVGIMIIRADIQTNERHIIYSYIADPETRKLFTDFFQNKTVTPAQPLFVKGDDKINNRIVRLINHQYDCSPWTDLIGSKFVPASMSTITSACGVAIPPSYGAFDGMVTIFLSKEPTDADRILLGTVLKDISNDVSRAMAKH